MADKNTKKLCSFRLDEETVYLLALFCARSGAEKSNQVDQAIRSFLADKIAQFGPAEVAWFRDAMVLHAAAVGGYSGYTDVDANRRKEAVDLEIAKEQTDLCESDGEAGQ